MKKQRLFRTSMTAFVAFIAIGLFAQEPIILDPSEMIPADTGYYIGGVEKDKDKDGNMEFYNKCMDEYGDANHNEAGVQQGFTYNGCMIMPTCWPKNAEDDHSLAEIDHAEGYIELTKTKYVGTDSAVMGYIISPPIRNLDSLVLETSPDVSSSDQRQILFWIEISKDNGTTWELNPFIEDETINKEGDVRTYTSDKLEFNDMIAASKEGPILIRIMSKPQIEGETVPEYSSQRVKIHYLAIYTTKLSSVNQVSFDRSPITISGNTIYSENGNIQVFNTLGQFMGEGTEIHVPYGIYIIKNEMGATQKILVK